MRIGSTLTTAALAAALVVTGAPVARIAAAPAQEKAAAAAVMLNLNTATQAELEKLPGVGAATAKSILDYRQKNGGFKKIEELMNVKGIGEKSFLKLKPQITVTPPKTADR